MVVDGQAVGKRPAGVKINPANRLGMAGGVGARDGKVDENITYEEGRRGGFDPHARIGDMDIDGIDATFLYPTLGLGFALSTTRRWRPPCAEPTIAGWRITALRILSVSSVSDAPDGVDRARHRRTVLRTE